MKGNTMSRLTIILMIFITVLCFPTPPGAEAQEQSGSSVRVYTVSVMVASLPLLSDFAGFARPMVSRISTEESGSRFQGLVKFSASRSSDGFKVSVHVAVCHDAAVAQEAVFGLIPS